jgi:hypothetical protein
MPAKNQDQTEEPPAKKQQPEAKVVRADISAEDAARAVTTLDRMRGMVSASKKKHKVFKVNYQQDFFEVCKQFVEFTLESATGTNNLDILCRPWAPISEKEQLPSWIPSVEDAAFAMRSAPFAPGGKHMARRNHDPFVSQSPTANSSSTSYNACRNLRPVWSFGGNKDPDRHRSLFVEGFIIDKIAEDEAPSHLGNVPVEWLHFAGCTPWDKKDNRIQDSHIPEPLWRTLVADRSPDGSSAKVYYAKAFEYAIDNSAPNTGVETTQLLTRRNPILTEFLKRMSAVVWNRRLFKSAQNGGLLGLAPKKAKAGDSELPLQICCLSSLLTHSTGICILKGCSVPVVLRKRRSRATGTFYRFIGECYLHTMMDGRAVDIQVKEDIPIKKFELR